MQFRTLQRKDIPQVRAVALKTWLHAYKKAYKPKTIKRFVTSYYSDKSFEKTFQKLKEKKEYFPVTALKNRVIGYAHCGKTKTGWELLRIYVLPKHHSKGIGAQLLKRCESFLRKKGAIKYRAYAHVKNTISMKFYKSQGFTKNKKKSTTTSICFEKNL